MNSTTERLAIARAKADAAAALEQQLQAANAEADQLAGALNKALDHITTVERENQLLRKLTAEQARTIGELTGKNRRAKK